MQLDNVYFTGVGIGISADQNSSDIVLSNVSAPSSVTSLLADGVSVSGQNLTLAGPFIGFYMRGECCDPSGKKPALSTSVPAISNSTLIKWEAPSGLAP